MCVSSSRVNEGWLPQGERVILSLFLFKILHLLQLFQCYTTVFTHLYIFRQLMEVQAVYTICTNLHHSVWHLVTWTPVEFCSRTPLRLTETMDTREHHKEEHFLLWGLQNITNASMGPRFRGQPIIRTNIQESICSLPKLNEAWASVHISKLLNSSLSHYLKEYCAKVNFQCGLKLFRIR